MSSSSKPPKKVHYTPSTKGSSVVGDRTAPSSSSSRPPVSSSNPKSSTRRPSISIHTTTSSGSSTRPQATDSGVGSSNASTSSTASPIPIPQQRNANELYVLKDRVQSLERENRQLSSDLQESNREKQQMRRDQERMAQMIKELEGKVKERVRDDGDGIRVRGGNIPIPEKKDRGERVPVTVERNTPPMTKREKERDSEARRKEDERLRAQHGTRERRTSFIPPSPSYRERQFDFDEDPIPTRSSYRDEERRSPPSRDRDPNPFAPAPAASRARRTSVSYGPGSPGGYAAPQGYSGMSMRSVYGSTSGSASAVPYIRGEVEVRSPASSVSGRVIGDAEDDLYPVDGKYHPYPL
ncbi:hypothetical protein CJF31_00000734 [Rutstroemia sp. NJR-2017a BVV2]|nr:hypothetical protein CJF31_00000734 [Rutstroemia sp. NJR-2017a BVV2]